jgi:FkbM family methyltransferase
MDAIPAPPDSAIVPPGRLRALIDRARNRATPAVARRRDRLGVRVLAAASRAYLDMFANVCFDMEINGELRVLQSLSGSGASCIFDVGANIGDWSVAAAGLFPGARIHAFEIVPSTAETMRARLTRAGVGSINVNSIGLSDERATVKVAYLPGFSQGSSVAVPRPRGDSAVQWRECPVRTGDDYCHEFGIDHIDFLKIDVEGLEGRVLSGFRDMLDGGRIDVIQFEYGHLNASVRFLLGDFYDLLAPHGYAIGKIYPDQVGFSAYDPWRDEDFRGPNYLAVKAAKVDLVRRLSGSDRR